MSVWISGTCVRDPRTDESILSERMPRMPWLFDVGFGQYGENSATKYVNSIFKSSPPCFRLPGRYQEATG